MIYKGNNLLLILWLLVYVINLWFMNIKIDVEKILKKFLNRVIKMIIKIVIGFIIKV